MDERSPLYLGFGRVLRQPWVWLVAVAWDLARWGAAWGLAALGLGWVRWDFSVGVPVAAGGLTPWLAPPPALPGAEQLGAALGAEPPGGAGWDWYLRALAPIIAMTLLEPLVRGGFLNQVNAALRGVRPGAAVFWRGVRRFGPNQALLTLLWIPLAMGHAAVAGQSRPAGMVLAVVMALAFWLAQFIIVTDDAFALQALIGAPILLWTSLLQVLFPVLLTFLVSAALTTGLGAAGWMHPLAVILPWGILGTALTGVLMAALQRDMSTRNEPGMPWVCRGCRAQNTPATDSCAVCGGHRHTQAAS